ncbi:hypothetical protein FB451DRAFT_1535184 [Mycena latifolia]|nr:hypothetical protein FB451DRAFT_1535184 [Mycena latifolia]
MPFFIPPAAATMLNIPRVSSVLAAVALESFFFGIYLIVTTTAVFLLLKRRGESEMGGSHPARRPLAVLFGICALFLLVAGYAVVRLSRVALGDHHLPFFFAFVYFAAGGGNPMVFYSDWAQPTEVLQTGLLMAALATMDALIVHRLWIIWEYNKTVVILPLSTLLGLLISGVGVTYEFTKYIPNDDAWAVVANHWIIPDCVFTLFTNVYCTGFMAYRIWKTDRIIAPLGGPSIMARLLFVGSRTL